MNITLPSGEVLELKDTDSVMIESPSKNTVTLISKGRVEILSRNTLLGKLRNHAVNIEELVL